MQLETDEHWYSLFGFFDAQSTEDERLELIHPRTRDSFLDEALLVLKTDPNDVLKTSILVFLEEHYDFFLDDRGRLQRTCAILSETLNHPTMSGQVKCQVLTTLTSIMITRDVLHFQPRALESFMNILFAIASQLNAPMDRLLRQTAVECIRELGNTYSGILSRRLGQLFLWAQEERSYALQSYLLLFSSTLVSTLQIVIRALRLVSKSSISSALFAPPDGYFVENDGVQPSEDQIKAMEELLCDVLNVPRSMRNLASGAGTNSAPGSFGAGSLGSYSSNNGSGNANFVFKLLDTSKPPEAFSIPPPPPSTCAGKGPLSFFAFEPFDYSIPTQPLPKRHPLINIVKKDLRKAVLMFIENLNYVVPAEALRLMSHSLVIIAEATAAASSSTPASQAPSPGTSVSASPRSFSGSLTPSPGGSMSAIPTANQDSFLRGDIVNRICTPYLQSNDPTLWHIVALLVMGGGITSVGADEAAKEAIIRSLRSNFTMVTRQSFSDIPSELRLVILRWILELRPDALPRRAIIDPYESLADRLNGFRSSYFPSVFDELDIIAFKLHALSYMYENKRAADDSVRAPTDLLTVLSALSDLASHSPTSKVVRVVFSALRLYLRRFPRLLNPIMRFIAVNLAKSPKLARPLLKLVKSLENSNDPRDSSMFQPVVEKVVEVLAAPNLISPPHIAHLLPLIHHLLTYKFIKPVYLVLVLYRYLHYSPDVCIKGNWQIGHKILASVTRLLLNFKIKPIFGQTAELLQYMTLYYGDVEIRDRAALLHVLVTHVPQDKIKHLLRYNNKKTSVNMDTLLPQTPSKSRFNVDLDDEDGSSFLKLVRLQPFFNYNSHVSLSKTQNPPSTGNVELPANVAATYLRWNEERNVSLIQLPFVLRFRDSIVPNRRKGPQSLFCVDLHFSPAGTKEFYKRAISNVSVPFLATSSTLTPTGSDNSSQPVEYGAIQSLANGIAAGSAVEEYKRDDGACVGQFPVSYACLVSIKVTIPMPAAFTVTAKYNLEDGHVAETKLDNLQMVLSDLFLPVDISTFSEELQQERHSLLHTLYEGLWDKFVEASEGNAASSVKYLERPAAHMYRVLKTRLLPFIVDATGLDSSFNTTSERESFVEFKALIQLPPKYHLLLRVQVSEKHSVVRLKTDFWRILAFMDKFLEEMCILPESK